MKNERAKSKRSIRQFIEDQTNILDFKQSWWQRYKQHNKRRAKLDESLEQLVNQTNKRIRIVANYRKKLRKSVAKLDKYIVSLVDQVITQMSFSVEDYQENALLQALFFEKKLCHQFFSVGNDNQNSSTLQHILVSTPYYKEVFMPVVEGDAVIQDARKTVLTFTHKRVVSSQTTDTEVKEALYEFFLDKFVSQIKQEIEPYMATGYSALKEIDALSKPIAPKEYLKEVVRLMNHPEQLFFVSSVECYTDKFGMVDSLLRDSSYRHFTYLAFHSKHEPTITLSIINRVTQEE